MNFSFCSVAEFTPLKIPHESFTDGTTMPPKNSFGSEEDTLHAYQCGFVVQHHAPNTIQFMKYDRCALDSNQLQFLACFDAPKAIDKDRLFIITYFLSDDSISVFERRRRNSGKFFLKSTTTLFILFPKVMQVINIAINAKHPNT